MAALEKSGGQKAVIEGTVPALVESMRRAGVDASVLLPIATKPSQVESINRFAAQQNRKNGIYAFGSVHPDYPEWKDALRRIKETGLYGVKLHPDFQGHFIDEPCMVAILQEAGRLGLPVLVHGGMDVSFPDVHRCTPSRVARILPEIEGVTLIVAHLGGYRYLDDVEQYLVGQPVYLDTSFVLGRFDQGQILRILLAHDPNRILFGTDSPWDGQEEAIAQLKGLQLPAGLEEKILSGNAKRLLSIPSCSQEQV